MNCYSPPLLSPLLLSLLLPPGRKEEKKKEMKRYLGGEGGVADLNQCEGRGLGGL